MSNNHPLKQRGLNTIPIFPQPSSFENIDRMFEKGVREDP